MTNPFEALRIPARPGDPDPEFATRLRARLLRAFDLPKGVTVSTLAEVAHDSPAPTPVRPVAVVPYLAVANARQALDWYVEALGARLRGDPVVMPDRRVGHAELEIADGGLIMLSDEHPDIGVVAPSSDQGVPITIYLRVPDVDSVIARAVLAGARLDRAIADYEYGRNGVIRDPFGHRWLVATEPVAEVRSAALRHGDIGYVSLWVPDADRAARFFTALLGWRSVAAGAHGYQVESQSLPHGINGGHPDPTLFLCYAVADIDTALDAVRAAGGSAEEVVNEPWGPTAMCRDNLEVPFAVYEPPEGVALPGSPSPAGGNLPGDVAYVTTHVTDSTLARDFYSAVLGWRWQPGRVEDGWTPENTSRMVGLAGGQERNRVIPMYRVDDIATAVARVRALGGRSTAPEQQPYGISAECEDDQGTAFYLGQL